LSFNALHINVRAFVDLLTKTRLSNILAKRIRVSIRYTLSKFVAGNGMLRRFRHALCVTNTLVIASTSPMGENKDSKSVKSFFQDESQGFISSE